MTKKFVRITAWVLAIAMSVPFGIGATAQTVLRGDFNGDGKVDSDDAVYLLRHTLAPGKYGISQPADVNGDGKADTADAIYLLYHTMFPERYALSDGASEGLAFELNYEENGYCVSGIGSCTDTDIVIPAEYNGLPVTGIGWEAFSNCETLKSVTIPDSVTSIYDSAFENCVNLTSVMLSKNVTSIGDYVFSGCDGLVQITVEKGNPIYHSAGNCLIETASKTLIAGCKNSVIPSDGSVTSIAGLAFFNCKGLESITIPNNVTNIGDQVFSYCSDLARITVEKGNPIYHSAGNCLIETASKTLIAGCKNSTIPSDGSVTSIGEWAFAGCSSLTDITIPNSVTKIGDDAFEGCALTKITIPESVTSVGTGAFYGCNAVTDIAVAQENREYHSAGNCLIETASKTLIAGCKNSVIPSDGSVTTIGEWAFGDCENLISLTIPDGVTSIGAGAFYYCVGLTNITIPSSVTSIDAVAFLVCENLATITFKGTEEQWDAIEKVKDWDYGAGSSTSSGTYTLVFSPQLPASKGLAFSLNDDKKSYSVSGIGTCTDTDIVIPAEYNGLPVTSVDRWAFVDCSSLESLTIPDSVTSIKNYAVSGCGNLVGITVEKGNPVYHSAGNCLIETASKTLVFGCNDSVIPSNGSVTGIGDGAFSGCSSLESVAIPGSVISIGKEAFYGCNDLVQITVDKGNPIYHSVGNCLIETASKTLVSGCKNSIIPSDGSVTGIGYAAFSGYTTLTNIAIPNAVTGIDEYAFFACDNLATITFKGTKEQWKAVEKAYNWAYGAGSSTSSGTYTLVFSPQLPASKGLAFSLNGDKKSYSVSGIGSCTDTDIVIPAEYNGLPVTKIKENAFSYCVSLTSVLIPESVTSIEKHAFSNCVGLTSLTIPDGVTDIGVCAFYNCYCLANLTLSGNVKSIGTSAFYGCRLTNLAIPSSVTYIGNGAFSGCSELVSIMVEKGNPVYHSSENCLIETASKTLIVGCKNSIIPSDGSVTGIDGAFSFCRSLTTVTIPNSVTKIGDYAFSYCSNLESILYKGTKAQWNAVSKGKSWDEGTGNYTLVFSPEK